MRQLFVFCDGTNNTLRGGVEETNVVTLYRHLQAGLPDQAGVERFFYYDPGVGAPDTLPPVGPIEWLQGALNRTAGLASGKGVYENIANAYLFLMQNWTGPDDRIYIFGFSRGAFTARCVAGMVNLFGIVRQEHAVLLPTLVHTYFAPPAQGGGLLMRATRTLYRALSKKQKAAAEPGAEARGDKPVERGDVAAEIGELFATAQGREAWVHWVGVWDTVESVGLPGPLSRSNPASANVVGKRYRNVRHALSLDEHRYAFVPRLYEEPGDIDDGTQTLKQRWFPGVHCDVGGSYAASSCGLSDAALAWMCEELAQDLPVPPMTFKPGRYERHDPLWDTPFWALAGMVVRRVTDVKVESARAAAGTLPAATTIMTMYPAPALDNPPGARIASVWEGPRARWPLALAAVVALFALSCCGYALLSAAQIARYPWAGWDQLGRWQAWSDGIELWELGLSAAYDFAADQLSALWGAGLLADGNLPWQQAGQPGWSTFWDLAYLGGWGYILARVASRAFAWMAGVRNVRSPAPRWFVLGMAPLVLVAGCLAVDGFTWCALAAHGMGVDWMGKAFTRLVGLSWVAKLAGAAGCVPLAVLRYWIAFRPAGSFEPMQAVDDEADPKRAATVWPRQTTLRGTWRSKHPRYRSSDLYALTGVAFAAAGAWAFARAGLCWGNYGIPGAILCKSHYLVVAMGVFGLFSLAMLVSDFGRGHAGEVGDAGFARLRAARLGYRDMTRGQVAHVFVSALLAVAFFALAAAFAAMSSVLF